MAGGSRVKAMGTFATKTTARVTLFFQYQCWRKFLNRVIRDIWFQMPNALHRGSPRQLGLPQYSNWSVMSLFSLSNNLTFEKDLLPTSGKLLSYVF